MDKKFCIFGTGGFAKEALACLLDQLNFQGNSSADNILFVESNPKNSTSELLGFPVMNQADFNPESHKAFIAIGSPAVREKVVTELPKQTEYFSIIHPTVIKSKWVEIGEGSILCAGTILTCEIILKYLASFSQSVHSKRS